MEEETNFYSYELMDRVHVLKDSFYEHILNHSSAIEEGQSDTIKEFYRQANGVAEKLEKMYQLAGRSFGEDNKK